MPLTSWPVPPSSRSICSSCGVIYANLCGMFIIFLRSAAFLTTLFDAAGIPLAPPPPPPPSPPKAICLNQCDSIDQSCPATFFGYHPFRGPRCDHAIFTSGNCFLKKRLRSLDMDNTSETPFIAIISTKTNLSL
jgi:hypothetical protein